MDQARPAGPGSNVAGQRPFGEPRSVRSDRLQAVCQGTERDLRALKSRATVESGRGSEVDPRPAEAGHYEPQNRTPRRPMKPVLMSKPGVPCSNSTSRAKTQPTSTNPVAPPPSARRPNRAR